MDQAENLRTLMENRRRKSMRVIAITGAKGGVGKSSVALNFAIALSKRGRRVLLMDSDFGLANIDIMLGVKPQYDLSSVLREETNIRDAVEFAAEGVAFLSGGSGIQELLTMGVDQLEDVLSALYLLDDIADTLIFDTGAGINERVLRLILASDDTIVITTPEPTAIMDAYALVKTIGLSGDKRKLRLVMNQVESEREARYAMDALIHIAQRYTGIDVEPLGYILRDENMAKAIKKQVPLLVMMPKSAAAVNIGTLADRYDNRMETAREGIAGFLGKLMGKNSAGHGQRLEGENETQ